MGLLMFLPNSQIEKRVRRTIMVYGVKGNVYKCGEYLLKVQ
jgi:hypothetical protein